MKRETDVKPVGDTMAEAFLTETAAGGVVLPLAVPNTDTPFYGKRHQRAR